MANQMEDKLENEMDTTFQGLQGLASRAVVFRASVGRCDTLAGNILRALAILFCCCVMVLLPLRLLLLMLLLFLVPRLRNVCATAKAYVT